MSRRHYVYFRVAAEELEAAAGAIAAVQSVLCKRHRGLGAELLRRPAQQDGAVTLMEVWTFGPGHDVEAIESEAAAASARWCRGTRHVEVFEPLDPVS